MSVDTLRQVDVDRAMRVVGEHANTARLARFAYDMMTRQAEGKVLFSGAQMVQKKAAELGIVREQAAIPGSNLLEILERGAVTPLDKAVVAAFAVRALEDFFTGEDAAAFAERLRRFLMHAEWLELATDYRLFVFMDGVLSLTVLKHLLDELTALIIADATGIGADFPEVRAKNAFRLTVLSRAESYEANEALRRIVGAPGLDPATAALARDLAGPMLASKAPSSSAIEADLRTIRPHALGPVLRLLTGWSLVSALMRFLRFVVGFGRKVSLQVARGAITLRTRDVMLGRVIREAEWVLRLDELTSAGKVSRLPQWHLWVGVSALTSGILLGGLCFFDGVRTGEFILLASAAVFVGVGAALDLALDLWSARLRGRVFLELRERHGRRFILSGVSETEARRFLETLDLRRTS